MIFNLGNHLFCIHYFYRELEENYNRLQRKVNQAKDKLTSEVVTLEIQDELKHSIVNVEDPNGLNGR